MKKYLITSAAALAFCGLFTSCSHDMDDLSAEESVFASYEKAFITAFGQPAPTQTWGFGTITKASTRAGGEFADHIGAYPDANMWTSKGFLAPDPLTPSQKLRAQYYFQMNHITDPNCPDNGQIDFFMQQVYDGGDDPMPGKSPEVYKSIANTDITSGEHMDHLTCGPDHTHTYNFNNGTCSPNPNVANRDQTDVNNTSQQHTDRIQLLLNTKTSCFGYANSDASYVRDDRWTLVSAKTIDDFCDGDPNFASWLTGKLANETDKRDVKCDDEFHRSFIGFDFDMLPDDKTYVWNYVNGQKTTPKTVTYSWASPQGGNLIYTEDGQFSEFTDWNAEITVKNGKVFRVLDSNTNMYCGDVKGMGGMDGHSEWTESAAYDPNGTNDNSLYLTNIPGHQSDHRALNLKFLAKKYEEGWLPVDTKQLKLWVQIGGCDDGYYSDWIVTFLPADSNFEPSGETVRVVAEDLTASAGNDFDFNDVVFDVSLNKDKTYALIVLRAAGGTLPLYIGEGDKAHEVHAEFGQSTGTMINTGGTDKGYANCVDGLAPKGFALPNPLSGQNGYNVRAVAKAIKVVVMKNVNGTSTPCELKAEQGEATAKLCVGTDYQYTENGKTYPCLTERTDIQGQFIYHSDTHINYNGQGKFTLYVKDIFGDDWYKTSALPRAEN